MNLSNRLDYLANEIEVGEAMVDIGCDHGFLPIYLIENKISPKVILCDISNESLNKAKENFNRFLPEYTPDARCGDGLKVVETGEAEAVVIAGMGGILISEILSENIDKTLSFKKLVLQPRSHIEHLRRWLAENGFYIVKEGLVKEVDNICEIITAIPLKPYHYMYPVNLVYQRNPLTKEYLLREYQKYKGFIKSIEEKSTKGEKYFQYVEIIHWLDYLNNMMGSMINSSKE